MSSATSWTGLLNDPSLRTKVSEAKVLCVGSGGIGCELVKTLACTGFKHIELVDLDTIETSNLNRQFLFRRHHVGQSKATVAAEVIQGLKPDCKITAHQANIKEARWNVDFFNSFDLVLNGLDNLEARRHVNRLCMAAGTPLVESGTAGYLGQVTVHLKGETECFECQPKSAPKSFPICTLRNTPDRPIHCIVWSKDLLFTRLFGKPEANDLDDGGDAPPRGDAPPAKGEGEAQEEEEVKLAAAAASADASRALLRGEGEDIKAYASRVFTRVYAEDMDRLAAIHDLWKKRAPPKSLILSDLITDLPAFWASLSGLEPGRAKSASKTLGLKDPNQKWSTADNARVFLASIFLYHTYLSSEVGSECEFDKEDEMAVDFVTSASNLRSICYDIPVQSVFDAKGMAGNIIHAIATTNAIISGLIVVEALKILSGVSPASSRCTFLYEQVSNKRLMAATLPERPSPSCMACGQAQLHLRVNTTTFTLQELISLVVKKRLAVSAPILQCGGFFYEEGEGLDEDEIESYQKQLVKTLANLPGGGLVHNSIVAVKDDVQQFNLELIISHEEKLDSDKFPEAFDLQGNIPPAQAQAPQPEQGLQGAGAGPSSAPPGSSSVDDNDDDCILIEDHPPARAVKRKADGEAEGSGAAKRGKTDPEVIEL